MDKRVLVTGATGFIGQSALVPLLERGYEVHALYTRKPIPSDSDITWHQADLLADTSAEKLCHEIKPTHLLHFAWYVNPKDYKTSQENDHWTSATLALVQAFQKNGGKRAVLAGTCMEYDWNIGQDKLTENAPISMETAYGRAKNETRIACERFTEKSGLSFAWGRIFNVYGPHEAATRLVPQIVSALRRNEPPRIAAGVTVDYLYVKDVADAFVTLLEREVRGVINVASGKPVTLMEVGKIIAEIMRKSNFVQDDPNPKYENKPFRVVADVTKLTEELHWHAHYSLHAGLEQSIASLDSAS